MSASLVDKEYYCPKCNGLGELVSSLTVKHLLREDIIFDEKAKEYYICFDEVCDVVYFQNNSQNFYTTSNLNIPIWFKKDANPKYICYCNKVTEEQIISAVVDEGARNMKDIIDLTGAMINGRCEVENPLGKCCSPYIIELVRKTIREMDE